MKAVATHPHIQYEAGPAAWGGWMIECACLGCGDRWHRPCQFPARTDEWIARYVNLHKHCRPRRQAAPPLPMR